MRLSRAVSFALVGTLLAAGCDRRSEASPAAPEPRTGAPAALPGVDVAGLDPSQVKGLDRLLDEKPSACGKPHSLRTSLKTDPRCKRSVFAARYLVTLLRAGLLPSEAEERYDERFTSPRRARCDVASAPMKGNPNAPIVLVEFSDFQCPVCKRIEPILTRIFDEYRDSVKLYFKNYPITKLHPEAADAAAAAVAAGKQNKFWQMHAKLFANQDKLAATDLERYAAELKLDVKKWKADMSSARESVERDRNEGEKLEISGTPTLYINERKYAGRLVYEDLKDWIDEELNK